MVNVQQSVLIHFIARDQLSGTIGLMSGALATFGISAIKMASNFDLAMARIASLLPETRAELKHMDQQVLDLSKSLGVDATEAANGLYEAISSGIPQENGLTFIAVASKAAIAGLTDTKTAVDGMTSAVNAFGLDAANVTDVADQMFQAVNIGKFTFEELSAAMGVASPLAAATAVSLDEMLAAASSITKTGVTVSVAMTQIRSALTALNKPSKNLQEIFDRLGVQTGAELVQKFGTFQGALGAIRGEADAMGLTLSKVFGRVEAVQGTLSLTGENAQGAAEDLNAVTNTVDAMGKAFADIDATPARRWTRLIEEFQSTMIEFGNTALPVFEGITQALRKANQSFEKLPDPVKAAMVQLALLVGTLGLATAAAIRFSAIIGGSALATGFKSFISGVQGATTALRLFGLQAIFFASTTQLVVGGLAAIGLAIAAIDIGMRAFTGRGLIERIFGFGDTPQWKEDTALLEQRIKNINTAYGEGSEESRAATLRLVEIEKEKVDDLAGAYEELLRIREENEGSAEGRSANRRRGSQREELEALNDLVDQLRVTGTVIKNTFGEGSDEMALFLTDVRRLGPEIEEAFRKGDSGKEFGVMIDALDARVKDLGLDISHAGGIIGGDFVGAFQILNPEIEASAEAAEEAEQSFADWLDTLSQGRDEIMDMVDALQGFNETVAELNPRMAGLKLLQAQNNLEIARIKGNTRDAAGAYKELTEAEEARIDALERGNDEIDAQIELMEAETEVVNQQIGVLNAWGAEQERLGNLHTGTTEALNTFLGEIINLNLPIEQLTAVVNTFGFALMNIGKNNPQVIAQIVALKNMMGAESPGFALVAQLFVDNFANTLLAGVGDPFLQAQLIANLQALLGIDLSGLGAAVGNSYIAGMKQALASGIIGISDQEAFSIFGNIAEGVEAIMPDLSGLGGAIGGAIAGGLPGSGGGGGGGGGGSTQEVKTAIDGFVSTFDSMLREAILDEQWGEIGGELIEKLVVAIEENTEAAGDAVATALHEVINKLKEIHPGPDAEEFGKRLTAAVRAAIEAGTPGAVQAVMDMIQQILGAIKYTDIAIEKANTLGDALVEAIRRKWTKERDWALDSIQKEIDALETLTDAQLEAIDTETDAALEGLEAQEKAADAMYERSVEAAKEASEARERILEEGYKQAVKRLEDETEARRKALEDQIEIIQDGVEAESRANDEIDHQDKMAQLRNDYERATSNAERARIQKQIDREIREDQARHHRDEADEYIDNLREKIDLLKEAAEDQKDVLRTAYDQAKQAEEDSLKTTLKMMEDRREAEKRFYEETKKAIELQAEQRKTAIEEEAERTRKALDEKMEFNRKYYEWVLSEEALNDQALLLMKEGNMDMILHLLQTYYPNWQDAGRTLGEQLILGLLSEKGPMITAVQEILDVINQARAAVGLGPVTVDGSSGVAGAGRTYTVKPGDTLSGIAAGLGMSWQDLYGMNRDIVGDNPNLIYPGQVLRYAAGSLYTRGGLALIGENGPELMNMPRGGQIMDNFKTKQMFKEAFLEALRAAGGAGDKEVNIFIGQEKLEQLIVKTMTRVSRRTY